MRLDELHLWYLADSAHPRYVGALKLVSAGKGVSLHYGHEWLTQTRISTPRPEVARTQGAAHFGLDLVVAASDQGCVQKKKPNSRSGW